MSLADLRWLMRHTVPIAGERAAAKESWSNVLHDAGLDAQAIEVEIRSAAIVWDAWIWRHHDGEPIR